MAKLSRLYFTTKEQTQTILKMIHSKIFYQSSEGHHQPEAESDFHKLLISF